MKMSTDLWRFGILGLLIFGLLGALGCSDAASGGQPGDDPDPSPAPDMSPDGQPAPTPDPTPDMMTDMAPDATPDPSPEPMEGALRFSKQVIDAEAGGPAFVTVADVNADGRLDIVLSSFGQITGLELPTGGITVYEQGADLSTWTPRPILTPEEGIYWPNDVELHDLDDDGDLDAVVGTGFLVCAFVPGAEPCGGLLWFEQTDGGWTRHDIVPPTQDLFYHRALIEDIDGDGIEDLLAVGELRPGIGSQEVERAETQWFKGTEGPARFESTPRVIGPGMGSLPTMLDLDGDGDLDIASAEFFADLGASFAWYERTAEPSDQNPAGAWIRHVIDADRGPSIQLSFIPDMLGDGQLMAVGANHTNTAKTPPDPQESAIYLYEIPDDPTEPWPARKISEHIVSLPGSFTAPQAAPGIFGHGDAEGDGDIDLIVSGDGDPNLYLIEQTPGGQFATWIFDEGFAQAGGMKIVDLDQDGTREIIATGYENNTLAIYRQDDNGAHPLRLAGPDVDPDPDPDPQPDPDPDPIDPGQPDEDRYVGSADPYGQGSLNVQQIDLDEGDDGAPVPMRIHAPTEVGIYAVIVFHHGFVLRYELYDTLLEQLASHGFVIVTPTMYDTGGLPFGAPTVAEEVQAAASLRAWIDDNLADIAGVDVDLASLGYAGHSRGAKVAWSLLLDNGLRGRALAGIDPVDGTGGGPGMEGPEPRIVEGVFDLDMPSFILGTGLGPEGGSLSCSPEGDNYVQFWEASVSPAWQVVATEHGHMDMIDREACGLICSFCQSGPDLPAMTRATAGLLTAFFRASLQGDESAYDVLEDVDAAPVTIEAETL